MERRNIQEKDRYREEVVEMLKEHMGTLRERQERKGRSRKGQRTKIKRTVVLTPHDD